MEIQTLVLILILIAAILKLSKFYDGGIQNLKDEIDGLRTLSLKLEKLCHTLEKENQLNNEKIRKMIIEELNKMIQLWELERSVKDKLGSLPNHEVDQRGDDICKCACHDLRKGTPSTFSQNANKVF